MRVAYVCADPGIGVYGRKGASVHVQEVVRALARGGATVELFATRVDGDPPPDLAAVPLHPLPPVGKGELAARERRAAAANGGLRAALKAAGRARGGFDLVYERYSLWSVAGMAYARAVGVPAVLEVNAPLIEEQARHRGLADRDAVERATRRAFAAASAVVAVSEPVAAWVRARTAAPEAVHVMPNGVDPGRFAVGRPARDERTFTVGFVGTLKPWHGVEALVDAVATLAAQDPSHRLLVVGDGPQRGALERAVAERGMAGGTEFTGAVDPADVPALLARMDVAVAPYPPLDDAYFSPLKVYEYLAAGLPVVASAVGEIPGVVTDGVTGVLTPPGDAAALAAALHALRVDPARRAALGARGREAVTQQHTWDAVAGRILRIAGLAGADGNRGQRSVA